MLIFNLILREFIVMIKNNTSHTEKYQNRLKSAIIVKIIIIKKHFTKNLIMSVEDEKRF